ncbi:hypothetical protein N0V90_003004 [Kalmusia sp. IMI 367209]|nr:hypothetical protein N0V90_003004 [Kalmusia sp. IMI 367209]
MQLPIFSPLLLLVGVAQGSAIPGKYYNHAEAFAANVTSPSDGPLSTQINGDLVLVNQCNYDVYVWEAYDRYQSNMFVIPARSPFRKEFITSYEGCTDNCGVVYKVTRSLPITGGQGGNQVQFEYSSRAGILYYDISFVDCAKNLGYRTGDAANCPA